MNPADEAINKFWTAILNGRESGNMNLETQMGDPNEYEQFKLGPWGYQRYQELAEEMSPKQAMGQAMAEEEIRRAFNETMDVSRESARKLIDEPVDTEHAKHEYALVLGLSARLAALSQLVPELEFLAPALWGDISRFIAECIHLVDCYHEARGIKLHTY